MILIKNLVESFDKNYVFYFDFAAENYHDDAD